ncbi:MAG: hypothetical protein EI684_14325 [Candidatus Viridilinea halotolerans]|uniref:Zinc-finger domain-containing protein n=1 Tax=Candidatus Viridilinea halotolerans TaxID=2491704 RepID=A0A426TWH9_9CHLR|nr:MAG: hypothetical protein EI684_14325 [Candidatus Viridilinea halotolerans]
MSSPIPGCSALDRIRTSDLLAALDGEAAVDIVQHLTQCGACREAAVALATELAMLHAMVPRSACPAAEAWLRYHEHLLDEAEQVQLTAHLPTCSACRDELALLAEATLDLPAPTLIERLRASGQRILEALPQMPRGLPLPVVRGEAAEQTWNYQVEGFQLLLSYTPALAGAAGSLRGMLQSATGLLPQPAQVSLQRAAEVLAEDVIDEFGYFNLGYVPPDHYQLLLTLPELKIVVAELNLSA